MGLISGLVPVNMADQKAMWLASAPRYDYNPQFVYGREFSQKTLTKYGFPEEGLVELAKKILEELPSNFFPKQIASQEPFLSKEQIISEVGEWVKKLKLPELTVGFDENQVNRVMLLENKLSLRWPLKIDRRQLERILTHEITGHYQRSYNHWRHFGVWLKNLTPERRMTEEGLAQYLADHSSGENNQWSLALAALKYYLTYLALSKSFAEVFEVAYSYLQDIERSWTYTFRSKRGIEDTSRGGGFTKDLVYFEGYLAVDKWIKEHPDDWQKIFYGKLSLAEIEKFT
ncbi:DUF1704 domain-containing protein [Microgenomates group bacterium]|nr:DUF1704 domain-containing protein [Microgenomates group bacterium]